LLPGSYNWIFDNPDFELWCDSPNGQLLWISGDTGKGKTMLLCGITNELGVSALATYRLAYFFFQAADSHMNTATAALRGLLYMVVQQQPRLRVHVTERYFDIRSSLFGDTYSFKSIMEAFTAVIQNPEFQLTYLIIDGLDQCMVDRQSLLDFVIHSTKSFRVSWIVSSCDSPSIQEQQEPWFHQVRFDAESNANFVTASLQSFIGYKVSMLAHQNTYTEQTRDAVVSHLAANAENSFLWIATACKHLERVIERNVPDVLATLLPRLDTLYRQALQSMHQVPNFEVLYKPLLTMVTVLYRPIHLDELLAFMDLRDQDGNPVLTENIMNACGMFLVLQRNVLHFSPETFLLSQRESSHQDHKTVVASSTSAHSKSCLGYCDRTSYGADLITTGNLQQPSVGFSLDHAWITCGGRNTVWIPEQHRGSYYAVCGDVVISIATTGRLWKCSISPDEIQDVRLPVDRHLSVSFGVRV
jgi:hypothetical protein